MHAWMTAAHALLGEEEIAGRDANPKILAMFEAVGHDPEDRGDEEPWCGAFVGACLLDGGHTIADIAVRASSWETYGTACDPRQGAIAVVKRTGGKHVAFIWGVSQSHLYLLGGNQGNAVSIKAWPRSALIACRWPGDAPPKPIAPSDLKGSRIVSNGQAVATTGKVAAVGAAGAAVIENSPKSVTQTVSEWTGLGSAFKAAIDLIASHWVVPAAMVCAGLIIFGGRIVRARLDDAEKGKTL